MKQRFLEFNVPVILDACNFYLFVQFPYTQKNPIHNNSNNFTLTYKHSTKLLSQMLEVRISSIDRGILKIRTPPFSLYRRNILDAHLIYEEVLISP